MEQEAVEAARQLLQREMENNAERDRANPVLPSVAKDPLQAAVLFLGRFFTKNGFLQFVYYRENWYSYWQQLWSQRSEEDIDQFIHSKLQTCRIVDKNGELKPYPTNREVINEIKYQIKQVTGIPSHYNIPLVMRNGKWVEEPFGDGSLICKGTVVNMRSGVATSNHTMFIPNGATWAFNKTAAEPEVWNQFLASLSMTAEDLALLQEWMGYALSGDRWAQKGMLIIGPPRSGKGTIGHVLRLLLGDSMVSSPTLLHLGSNFGLQSLMDKRLCLLSDARLSTKADIMAVIEILLRVIANDSVSISRKFKEQVEAQLTARIMLLSNEFPMLGDASKAINHRFLILRLRETFLGREDTTLLERLIPELPAIANWCITGYLRLYARRRFIESSKASEMREQWHIDNNPISEFLRDHIRIVAGAKVQSSKVYEAYKAWAEEGGHPISSANYLSRQMTTTFGDKLGRQSEDGKAHLINVRLIEGGF